MARQEGEAEISEPQGQHCPLSGGGAGLDCQEEEEQADRGSHRHPAGSEESHPGNVYQNIVILIIYLTLYLLTGQRSEKAVPGAKICCRHPPVQLERKKGEAAVGPRKRGRHQDLGGG